MQDFEGRLKIRMDGHAGDTTIEVDGKPLSGVTEIHVYCDASGHDPVAKAVLTVELVDFEAQVITTQEVIRTIKSETFAHIEA